MQHNHTQSRQRVLLAYRIVVYCIVACCLVACSTTNNSNQRAPVNSKWVKKLPATDMSNQQRERIIITDASISEPEIFQVIDFVDIESLDLYAGKDELFRPYDANQTATKKNLINTQDNESNEDNTTNTIIADTSPTNTRNSDTNDQYTNYRPENHQSNHYQTKTEEAFKTHYVFSTDDANLGVPTYQYQPYKDTLSEPSVRVSKPSQSAKQNELNHFVIQLLAANSISDIRQFVQRYQLPKNQLWVARTQSNGKTWLVLFYGDYNRAELANKEANSLYQQYGLNDLWIRPLPKGIALGGLQ